MLLGEQRCELDIERPCQVRVENQLARLRGAQHAHVRTVVLLSLAATWHAKLVVHASAFTTVEPFRSVVYATCTACAVHTNASSFRLRGSGAFIPACKTGASCAKFREPLFGVGTALSGAHEGHLYLLAYGDMEVAVRTSRSGQGGGLA